MERFEPTHRDLARVNSAVAVRGRNLQRLVNSLRRLNDALAAKQTQIVQLVDSSEKVFGAFASEDSNVSRAVADLPGDAEADHRDAGQGAGVRQAFSGRRRTTCSRPLRRSRPPTRR